MHPHGAVTVAVFAPSAYVTVAIERVTDGGDEIHFHAGGQGVWVARTVAQLGEPVSLHSPVGGESGSAFEALIRRDRVMFAPVRVTGSNPAYVQDRRMHQRQPVAESSSAPLSRHELDNLYQSTLAGALAAGLLVVTGRHRPAAVPDAFYRRLGADLAQLQVRVVGDFHGAELCAFLERGRIDLLKVSDEDLQQDGICVDNEELCFAAMDTFRQRNARDVVLSRGTKATLALIGNARLRVDTPEVASPDHRGSGDAMTGALAVGLVRALETDQLLALGCGAGAASATRHGLASADVQLIAEFAALSRVFAADRPVP